MVRRILITVPILALAGFLAYRWLQRPDTRCDICERPLHAEIYFRIDQKDGQSKDVCCPRCGFLYLDDHAGIARRLRATDFTTRALIPAEEAFYVEGSDVHLCRPDDMVHRDMAGAHYERVWDRCLPSLVAFKKRSGAEEFGSAHGGQVLTYRQLRPHLAQ